MQRLNNKQIQHLYWRIGFGISPKELNIVKKLSKDQIIDRLLLKSEVSSPLSMDFGNLTKRPKQLSREERKELRKLRNKKMNELNLLWCHQLINTDQILREKMTLFFHDHFAVRLRAPRINLHLNNIIRKHALGSFKDMLMEVSKSPAMLTFLNNRQNRKNQPNENFAREVMELFTLGRDNGYTEKDIKEAARAFTGWNFRFDGGFVFRPQHHDYGSKTILGKTGNFMGEDVINLLLEQKQTALLLSTKLYRYFVNENINPIHTQELADIMYTTGYDLKSVVKHILSSDWFYHTDHIGVKIKSPIELIIGLCRPFDITFQNPKVVLYLQKKLNQILFFPPNVAGWPGGKAWIDNSTLMLRLKLASLMLNSGVIEWSEKENMPENMILRQQMVNRMKSKIQKKVKATPNWDTVLSTLRQKDNNALIDFFIQPHLSETAKKLTSTSTADTKNFIIELLSLPEYQLC